MRQLARPRRNRRNQAIRDLVSETQINIKQIIYPVFVCEGNNISQPIKTLSGQFQLSPDMLSNKIHVWKNLGIIHYALFPKIDENKKDKFGRESLNDNGLLARTIKKLKDDHPEIVLYTDVALDPYSSDGHDGIVENGNILNDQTVEILSEMAVKQAYWGTDWVAPSDMMDGRVGAIRRALENSNYTEVGIMSYSAKYASCFYGPFRDALQSAPKSGDKKSYQMDPRNIREAIREVKLDVIEGADMVMIKPALAYLDVISAVKKISAVPVAAYNVSGEYAMIKAASNQGILDEDQAILETMWAFKRAGADIILTYFAPNLAELLRR